MAQAAKTEATVPVPQTAPLKISRVIGAPRETVFRAWSSADHVKRWFAPATFTIPEARVELRVGGPFELSMRSPAGEVHRLYGSFVEISPNARLVIDMRIEDAAGAPLFRAYTEVDFTDAPEGTRLDVTQTYTLIDLSKAWMIAGAPQGWNSTLDNLATEAARMRSETDAGRRSVAHGSFHLERSYDAPVARVWQALTNEVAKQKWFVGPAGWKLLERRMDVRPDGRERLQGQFENGRTTTFDAIYHDVTPHQRLIYSYEMRLDERKISVSLATIELKAEPGKTTLRITEQGAFLDGYDDAGSREQGTGHLLDALGASLAA